MLNEKTRMRTRQDSAQKQKDNFGAALQRMNQKSVQEKKMDEDYPSMEFFRELSRPRGKKYIELVTKIQSMQGEIIQKEALIRELEAQMGSEESDPILTNMQSDRDIPELKAGSLVHAESAAAQKQESSMRFAWETVAEQNAEQKTERSTGFAWETTTEQKVEQKTEQRQTSGFAWENTTEQKTDQKQVMTFAWETSPEQKPAQSFAWDNATSIKVSAQQKAQLERLKEELTQLKLETQKVQEMILERMPKGDPYITSVFWSDMQDELMRRGIIMKQGTPYNGAEDLCERCNAQSEQEIKIISLGNQVLNEPPQPLIVEIYLHAVCKVFMDGTVKVFRG